MLPLVTFVTWQPLAGGARAALHSGGEESGVARALTAAARDRHSGRSAVGAVDNQLLPYGTGRRQQAADVVSLPRQTGSPERRLCRLQRSRELDQAGTAVGGEHAKQSRPANVDGRHGLPRCTGAAFVERDAAFVRGGCDSVQWTQPTRNLRTRERPGLSGGVNAVTLQDSDRSIDCGVLLR